MIGAPTDERRPELPAKCGPGTGCVPVVAYPRGSPGLEHQRGNALALELHSRPDRDRVAGGTPGRDPGRRPVELVACHVRRVGTKEQADLTRDRREHLGRRDPARDQRRDAPQRGLLVREARRSPRLALRARRQLADDQRRHE